MKQHRCCARWALIQVTLGILTASSAWAQTADDAPSPGGVQGSFRPPIVSQNTDTQTLSVVGLLVLAEPLTLYGVVLGYTAAVGTQEYPLLGYEATLDVQSGGGTLEGLLPEEFGGPNIEMSLLQAGGSITGKIKPIEQRENGYFGLLFYGTASLGLQQAGMTTTLGSAYSRSTMMGINAGIMAQGRIGEVVDIVAFGGYRVNAFVPPSSSDLGTRTVKAPEYGGGIVAHLPYDIDLKLSSIFSAMQQNDDEKALKIFVLGVTWSPRDGVSSIVDGGPP